MDFPAPYSTGHPQPYPSDGDAVPKRIETGPMPPLIELATALHEVEEQLGSLGSALDELQERRGGLSEQRRAIRAKLADILNMAEAAEAKSARPTF